jgi:heme oxygenase
MHICKFKQAERDDAKYTFQQIIQLPEERKFKASELKKWLEKNELRKTARAKMVGVKEYKYTFPLQHFQDPARPSKGKFLKWNMTGINALNANAWLCQNNHGWEFG